MPKMKLRIGLISLIILFNMQTDCFASSFLKDEQFKDATTLAKTNYFYEDFRSQKIGKSENDKQDFLAIEEFNFKYKEETNKFIIAHSFDQGSNWGEIAVYAGDVNPLKIRFYPGSFSDLCGAAMYLSVLKYKYVPATDLHPSYFILENINAGYNAGGKGYSQVCVDYFMKEFISNHTKVNYVFSDARNRICQHFFPRYGLQAGMAQAFQGIKFASPLRDPYFWERNIK
jgi:hypothetical protein